MPERAPAIGSSTTTRLDNHDPGFEAAFEALISGRRAAATPVTAEVAAVVADVRARGDAAIAEYAATFDGRPPGGEGFRIAGAAIERAASKAPEPALAALELAAARIESFHRRQLPEDVGFTDDAGIELGWRWTALEAVGVYVPGGTAAYPSSVLMAALPARVAGVERIAMTTPMADGEPHPLVAAAAMRCGVDEVYALGGAHAIAALAYGSASLPAVDKIVGPGNVYVAEAKRQVFGDVGIDAVAGPSEVVIVADAANEPAWIAADLLAQAEHDARAQAIAITDDRGFATRLEKAVTGQLDALPRAEIARASWRQNGAVIVVGSLDQAPALVDRIAPEHLELAVAEPRALAAAVGNAGAIFLGRHAPEALGDYVAGPSHVLPTAGAARFASGLSVFDFLKRTTLIGCEAAGLAEIGPAAVALAEAEGLDGHAHSVRVRFGSSGGG